MTDHPLEWLKDQPAAVALLVSYSQLEELARATAPRKPPAAPVIESDDPVDSAESEDDSATWIPRITTLPDVQRSDMPAIHGRLIALGLLKFELFGKSGGIRYRLSTLGRKALTAPEPVAVEPEPTLVDEPELEDALYEAVA
jgi:hypothetical protein